MPYDPNNALDQHLLAEALVTRLESAGFAEEWHGDEQGRGRDPGDFTKERTFFRPVEGTKIRVRVCTTIHLHQDRVRASGKDAIRVLAIYRQVSGKDRILDSETRVHRVGEIPEIVERMMDRARDLWRTARATPLCARCGAPTFVSKKGNPACADACWTSSKRARSS